MAAEVGDEVADRDSNGLALGRHIGKRRSHRMPRNRAAPLACEALDEVEQPGSSFRALGHQVLHDVAVRLGLMQLFRESREQDPPPLRNALRHLSQKMQAVDPEPGEPPIDDSALRDVANILRQGAAHISNPHHFYAALVQNYLECARQTAVVIDKQYPRRVHLREDT